MTSNYHTPIATGAAANASIINAPLGELDAAISAGLLLANGTVTGATAQAQAFTVGVSLADTTTSTAGVVFKGSDRFIHNFHHPTGNTNIPDGYNTFVGVNAGNFTLGSTATATAQASYNTIVGAAAFTSATTGACNTAVGYQTLTAATTQSYNTTVGYQALKNVIGSYNVAVGCSALTAATSAAGDIAIGYNAGVAVTTGDYNIAVGYNALSTLTTAHYNIAIGYYALGTVNTDHNIGIGYHALRYATSGDFNIAHGYTAAQATTTGAGNMAIGCGSLYNNTTGSYNIAIGFLAGATHANGSTALTTPENSIYIGYGARGYNNDDDNSIVIGYVAVGLGANTTVIGNTSTTITTLYGKLGVEVTAPAAQLHVDQAVTDAAVPVLTLDQADVSEPFVKLIGESTTDNSQSLIDAADLEDPGAVVGWFKVYVEDVQGTNPIADGAYWVPFYATPTHSA